MKQITQYSHKKILDFALFLTLILVPGSISKAETYYYDVTTFGAKGTDTKDDADAIQEALDKATEEDYIVVTVPDGTYILEDTLYIHSNTTLQLSSNAIIKRQSKVGFWDENLIRTADDNYSSATTGGYDLAHDITITGGTWDGGTISKANATSNLIYLGHASNITISDTTIQNCYGAHAIEFAGVKDSAIRNCYITGFRYGPNNFTAEAIQLDVCYKSDTEGEWTPGYMLDKTTCSNIVIEGNTIVDYPRGIGIHHSLAGHEVTDIVIRNNTMKRSSAANQGKSVVGVFLQGVKNATVDNNIFDYCSYGAMVKQSNNVILTNNQFLYNPIRNLTIEGSTSNLGNGVHSFVVTKDKIGTKKFVFTRGKIKTGTVKTRGKTYKFKWKKKKVNLTLKKKIKANQTVKFTGTDSYGNKYYRTYKVPKSTK